MTKKPLILPALRGHFGDWIYYACLMSITDVGARVSYAEEVHTSKALSQFIQRSLEGPRAKHIAEYLTKTEERFFSSLVLAIYKGAPQWLEVGNFRAAQPEVLKLMTEQARDSIGFLQLSGREKIFALDGQHRLAGIRRALSDGVKLANEQVPVIFVGHKTDAAGQRRTRRLFTTLNKTAVRVLKKDIIALDEDDVMAITARRLVETNPAFKEPKIAVVASQSVPVSNKVAIATITTLYDTLKLIFMHTDGVGSDRTLRFNRPSDVKLDEYYGVATNYFDALSTSFKPVGDFFASASPATVTAKHKGDHGGHLLFRPIGLEILTRTAIRYAKEKKVSLSAAVQALEKLPVDLAKAPYRNVIWDPVRKVVLTKGKPVARDVACYMVGLSTDTAELVRAYRRAQGAEPTDTKIKLPKKVV